MAATTGTGTATGTGAPSGGGTLSAPVPGLLAPPPRIRVTLSPQDGAVEAARDHAGAVCRRWEITGGDDAVATVVTELVTNVVVHARTPMELTFALWSPFVHVAVRDGDPRPPVLRPGDDHGLGLRLVDAFASRWGWRPAPDGPGKIVWAAIRLPYHARLGG